MSASTCIESAERYKSHPVGGADRIVEDAEPGDGRIGFNAFDFREDPFHLLHHNVRLFKGIGFGRGDVDKEVTLVFGGYKTRRKELHDRQHEDGDDPKEHDRA